MRKILSVFTALFLCMLAYPHASSAVSYPLTTYDFSFSNAGAAVIFDPGDFTFTVDFGQFSDDPAEDIHFNVFTALGTQGGTTFVLDSGPTYDAAVEFLTDGENEHIRHGVTTSGGGAGFSFPNESALFFDDPSGAAGIDFKGYRINSLSLDFVSFHVDVPGEDPNGDGIWTDYSMTAYMHIDAEKVPEPSILIIFGSGLLLAALMRRKAQVVV